MKKNYSPSEIEKNWYQNWEQAGNFSPDSDGEAYCIMLPPPNITGTLHMGHAFQVTLMDCLARYQRMQNKAVLWQPGTDHAGIATQMVIERQLEAQHSSRQELGREKFIQKTWEWKNQSGNQITQQLRRMGASLDWSRERFTMDEILSAAVKKTFIDLYKKKLIYRGKRLVNWDPVLKTAISDLEVLSEEENGELWHIRYPLTDGDELVVATTRPETMLGDVAVAVHPDDLRYQSYIGRQVHLPLTNRTIPVIGDDYVDPEFGTGCLKITPAHDFNDYTIWQKHQLPLINVLNADASMIADDNIVPAKYQKLDRYQARKLIVADLEQQTFLIKTEPHKMVIPRGDRSGAVIEPYLTDQWFMQTKPLAETAKKAVRDGRIRFIPNQWEKTYFGWMDQIEDWCISRQLWWGHRIPAWYDEQNNCYVGLSETAVRKTDRLADDVQLRQDEDVLDTWFSSALWPFSTLGWPDDTAALKRFYPTSVLVTGFDIIFFWVARMIMMGLEFMGDVPFREVYIHGLVRDAEGNKMSKSKGNVLDPIDLIDGITLEALVKKRTTALMQSHLKEKISKKTKQQFPNGIPAYGTDALRFTFMAMASNNRDIRFDLKRIEGYRNFCNKLWNACRLVMLLCQEQAPEPLKAAPGLAIDCWISNRADELAQEISQHMQAYRFDLVANSLYEFVWHDYCDWYLEFSKIIQNSDTEPALKAENRACLVATLDKILQFLHPIIPFITEELWQQLQPLTQNRLKTIQYSSYPGTDKPLYDLPIDNEAATEIRWVQSFITAIRKIRSEINISPAKKLPLLIQNWNRTDRQLFGKHQALITQLAKLEKVNWIDSNEELPQTAIALLGQTRLLIPLAGLVDIDAEISRLDKGIVKLQQTLNGINKRLNNADFIQKASAEIIEHQRQAQQDTQAALLQLQQQIELLNHQ